MAEQGESNPFKKLAEVFRKKPPTETKPTVQKPTKPKEVDPDDDPGYITIISPGTGFPHRIPRGK